MWNFFKIASNTFKESVREPVFCLLLVCALVLIAHFPSVALFVFYEQLKTVVDSSMATSMLFGLFAAVLASSHTVAQEMRNGTVLLLLSQTGAPVELRAGQDLRDRGRGDPVHVHPELRHGGGGIYRGGISSTPTTSPTICCWESWSPRR